MAGKFTIESLSEAINKIPSAVNKITPKIKNKISSDLTKVLNSMSDFCKLTKKSISKELENLVGDSFKLALELEDANKLVSGIFKDSSKEIDGWSKTLIGKFGVSELQAKKFTVSLADMMKTSGLSSDEILSMSKNLTELSGDYASLYDSDISSVFEKIKSVLSGNTEAKIGLNLKGMNEAEKTILRYNYIMESSTEVVGNFLRNSNSLSNVFLILKERLKSVGAEFIGKLIPVIEEATRVFMPLIDDALTSLDNYMKNINLDALKNNLSYISVAFTDLGQKTLNVIKILSPFLPLVLGLIGAFKVYQGVLIAVNIITNICQAATMAFNAVMSLNPLGVVILSVIALITVIAILVKNWDSIKNTIIIFIDYVNQFFQNMLDNILKVWDSAKTAVADFVSSSVEFFQRLLNKIIEFIENSPAFLQALALPFINVIELIKTLFDMWKNVINSFKSEGIIGALKAIGGGILAFLLTPIATLLKLVSKIPGVGGLTNEITYKVNGFRADLLGKNVTPPTTTDQKITASSLTTTSRNEVVISVDKGIIKENNIPRNGAVMVQYQHSSGVR